ncbi:MAG: helix-turn-helix domain-containing protein [Candidatus Adiutrix sp.]|nr:helix-turn-helix domain-containing protein [Candidatus Adiutrix sp.]
MTTRNKSDKKRPQPHEVAAVVGLGLSLPGAGTVDEFWNNILERRRFFQPATALDWGAEPEHFYQEGGPALDRAYSLNGAFNNRRTIDPEGLKLPEGFDPKSADGSLAFWLAAGRDAAREVKWDKVDPGKVGVISGHVILPSTAMAEAAVSLYTREATRDWATKPQLEPPPRDAFRLMGYSARLLAQSLGFSGPAYTLDAACASSLYAVHLAVEDLLNGSLEAVFSGGVAKADALFTQLGFCQLRALAASGCLTPFDRSADGLIVGEGAVAFVLKRLDTALAHGDHIRAVIRGVGLSNDQTGNLLAPQAEGQLRAMKSAWRNAGLSPRSAGLIEAHGTGTILGDLVEVSTLKELLADPEFAFGGPAETTPVVGSVKSNIGHLLSAAAAAGLAKAVLSLEKAVLPPTAGFEQEAPELNLAGEPALRVLTRPEAWPAPPDWRGRLAAVNAFGFGGVNGQAIVEEYRPELWVRPARGRPRAVSSGPGDPPRVRLLSARALSAPWPDFASLAQNWMDSEGPPIIATRRFGALKATGLFFNSLVLEGASLRMAPKDLAHILPQQALALKMADEALASARLDVAHGRPVITGLGAAAGSQGVDKTRVGIFMGVDIDPRSADYAFRWLGPLRAAEALVAAGELRARDLPEFVEVLRRRSHPRLTASRVVGALGSLVASRVARFIGSGGPAFTVSEENISGLRVLKMAMAAINRGEIDLALAGVVDSMGDPKTAALAPRRLWEEGAAMLVLASDQAAAALGRGQAPELTELPELEGRLGGLGGLFTLVKNAFFISHRLVSRGLGAGAAYWIKNKSDPPRSLEAPGFVITEKGGEDVSSPPYSYEDATWFLVRARSREDSLALLNRLENLTLAAQNEHYLVEVLGPVRAEKRALKRLGDRFWAEYGYASGARPILAMLARGFEDLLGLIKKARARLRGEAQTLPPDQKGRIIWALEGERVRGELAWVFPGSGSHYHGLGRRLAMSFPHLMGQLEDGVSRLADHFQSPVFWGPGQKDISPIQAILGQVSFGLLGARVLNQFKVVPQAVLGYSLGETTALVATGAWRDRESLYDDLMKSPLFTHDLAGEYLAARRYFNWPKDRPFRWVMGVLPRSAEEINKALARLPEVHRGRAFLLLINTPGEGVVGGEEGAVRALAQSLSAVLCSLEGVAAVHNPSVRPVIAEYERFHTRPTVVPPGLRFYSSAWAKAYELNSRTAARSLTDQALGGHDFTRLIRQAYADGVRFFVEVGPGSGSSRMINNILQGQPHLASSLAGSAHDEGWLGLHRLLVELWMAGYPLKMSVLYPDAAGASLALPVPVTLAPTAEMWPSPEEALAQAAEERDIFKVPAAAEKPPVEAPAAAADPVRRTVDQARGAFDSWLAENRELRLREEAAQKADSPAPLSRADCLEFAVGRIARVLGPRFSEADRFPSRVRLPDEPLMLVDRVLALEGRPLSMTSGRIVTEHDILAGAWYLDQGHIPAGLAIESGQADLLLSAWLGADFTTRGLAFYRLLDAEVTFHRALPRAGETARYDIRILRFFKYGQTRLFRFEFRGTAGGQPLLSMKGGCAGFFTPAELAGGRGLPGGGLLDKAPPAEVDPAAVAFRSVLPGALSREQLQAFRRGDLAGAFGPDFRPALKNPLSLPGERMSLIDRVTRLEKGGGRYGAGFIRAEIDIDPQAWFLTCHFVGDEVMPGTLMYESCLHALRLFLTASGWVGESGQDDWQPVKGLPAALKCRGQVTARTRVAAYELHIRRLGFQALEPGQPPEPVAVAEAVMLADERPVVEVRNLNLRLAGSSLEKLKAVWAGRPSRPAASEATPLNSENTFNKERLLALAQGRPSEALGRAYARFDDGAFVARLPRPPYDFVDQAVVVNGRRYEALVGSEVRAVYTPPADAWLFGEAGGADPALPYAALNEIALQPCGFLAAYMGSALPFQGPMHFRNLGGRASVLAPVKGGQKVETSAKLTSSSRTGEMVIQHFSFTCRVGGRPVYEGLTHFGFFSPLALSRQAGLTGEKPDGWPARPAQMEPYPEGPLWPKGRWRMIERAGVDPRGGPEALGAAFAVAAVDPEAWFFKAHFYQDPVWPGSLGLEAFIQTLKLVVSRRFGADETLDSWAAPACGGRHEWLYRGQITPERHEMSLALQVRSENRAGRSLTADGLLMADGLPIYKISGFTVGLLKAARAGAGGPAITPDRLLGFRREKGLSQGQLARLMGVTSIYISLMERGKRNISPLMAEKLNLILAGELNDGLVSGRHSEILAKGTLKSRREEKEAASRLLSPERLRELRLARGLSQKKLADQVGVTATLIGLIELGKRGLNLGLARKILAVLED